MSEISTPSRTQPDPTIDDRPHGTKEAVTRTIAGETVLVPLASPHAPMQNYYLFNKVGSFLWKHLDGTRSRADLSVLVREQFSVPEGQSVEVDIDTFLGKLQARDLLRTDGPAGRVSP